MPTVNEGLYDNKEKQKAPKGQETYIRDSIKNGNNSIVKQNKTNNQTADMGLNIANSVISMPQPSKPAPAAPHVNEVYPKPQKETKKNNQTKKSSSAPKPKEEAPHVNPPVKQKETNAAAPSPEEVASTLNTILDITEQADETVVRGITTVGASGATHQSIEVKPADQIKELMNRNALATHTVQMVIDAAKPRPIGPQKLGTTLPVLTTQEKSKGIWDYIAESSAERAAYEGSKGMRTAGALYGWAALSVINGATKYYEDKAEENLSGFIKGKNDLIEAKNNAILD